MHISGNTADAFSPSSFLSWSHFTFSSFIQLFSSLFISSHLLLRYPRRSTGIPLMPGSLEPQSCESANALCLSTLSEKSGACVRTFLPIISLLASSLSLDLFIFFFSPDFFSIFFWFSSDFLFLLLPYHLFPSYSFPPSILLFLLFSFSSARP